jgi:hypothetical protein
LDRATRSGRKLRWLDAGGLATGSAARGAGGAGGAGGALSGAALPVEAATRAAPAEAVSLRALGSRAAAADDRRDLAIAGAGERIPDWGARSDPAALAVPGAWPSGASAGVEFAWFSCSGALPSSFADPASVDPAAVAVAFAAARAARTASTARATLATRLSRLKAGRERVIEALAPRGRAAQRGNGTRSDAQGSKASTARFVAGTAVGTTLPRGWRSLQADSLRRPRTLPGSGSARRPHSLRARAL